MEVRWGSSHDLADSERKIKHGRPAATPTFKQLTGSEKGEMVWIGILVSGAIEPLTLPE